MIFFPPIPIFFLIYDKIFDTILYSKSSFKIQYPLNTFTINAFIQIKLLISITTTTSVVPILSINILIDDSRYEMKSFAIPLKLH